MRKKLALFAMFAALSSWSFARTLSTTPQDKDDKNKKSTASAQNDHDADDKNGDIDVVSGPDVQPANDHAVIRWRTDKVSASSVKYGTSQNNMSQEQKISGGSRDHNVTLTGLQPGTKYYFEILSRNGQVRKTGEFTTQGSSSASNSNNNGSSSGSTTGATASGTDNVQILDGPRPQNVTPNSATIYWRTDDVAASDVKYGTDPNNPGQRAYERGGAREHTAELTNLQPGQTYYYQILRRDGSVRTSGQFQTPASGTTASTTPTTPAPGTPAPAGTSSVAVNKGPVVQYVNQNTAIISWNTNQQSSSTVKYGTDANNLNQTASGNWGTNHQVQVQGLQPSTTYYFVVNSSPAENTGNVATSAPQSFQTVAPGQQAKQQPWHF
ncbi:MAG: fibronectin type III domain-containing protein [Terriglobales bacterium]|jgi:phosphodiesterase/alkaline phosphatase D-like protein